MKSLKDVKHPQSISGSSSDFSSESSSDLFSELKKKFEMEGAHDSHVHNTNSEKKLQYSEVDIQTIKNYFSKERFSN